MGLKLVMVEYRDLDSLLLLFERWNLIACPFSWAGLCGLPEHKNVVEVKFWDFQARS